MSLFVLYSAIVLGLAGSFHCIGMCGPIAMGIASSGTGLGLERVGKHLLYFFGKTITYAVLGLVFGLFGQGLVLAGMQQVLSVTMGLLMVLLAVIYLSKSSLFHSNLLTQYLQNKLLPLFRKAMSNQGNSMPFFLGLLNGLLPCGLVYIGLAAAVATGHSLYSAAFMGLFGLGTIPLMLAFMFFSGQLAVSLKNKVQQFAPVLVGIMGVLLLVRGLDLGIPYLSPVAEALILPTGKPADAIGCHP